MRLSAFDVHVKVDTLGSSGIPDVRGCGQYDDVLIRYII